MSPWKMALTWMWRNLGRLTFSPSLAGALGFFTDSPVNVSALLTSCTVSRLRLKYNRLQMNYISHFPITLKSNIIHELQFIAN